MGDNSRNVRIGKAKESASECNHVNRLNGKKPTTIISLDSEKHSAKFSTLPGLKLLLN
jgi:hypothetical protein